MITDQDKMFLEYVKQHKNIGYGRMIQIISSVWHVELERQKPGMGEGAHVANTCVAFLSEEEKRAFLAVLEQEKKQGMDY